MTDFAIKKSLFSNSTLIHTVKVIFAKITRLFDTLLFNNAL